MNENNRLHYWAALTVFSVVSLSSMTNSFEDGQDWVREQKWAVSVAAISMIVGAFAFFLRMFMTEMFTEKHMEHVASFVVLVMWCAGLPNINDTSGFLARDMGGVLMNPNLFFSSWMAFIMAMMLAADIFPSMFLGDRVSAFTNHWMGFGAAALIAMTNAVMFWKDNCNSTDDNATCRRDLFAFVLGAISGFVAIAFFVLNHDLLERVVSIVLFAAWCFGVAYFTFDNGPATYVGTFYFSVWFSFMFSFWMAVHSVVALYGGMVGSTATEEAVATGGDGKVQEETAKHDAEDQEKEEVAGDV